MVVLPYTAAFLLLSFLQTIKIANSQSFIGINYGQVADNLPPPSSTAKLLQSTSIQKVRLYGSDTAIIKALANTGIGIVIGTANGDIPGLALSRKTTLPPHVNHYCKIHDSNQGRLHCQLT